MFIIVQQKMTHFSSDFLFFTTDTRKRRIRERTGGEGRGEQGREGRRGERRGREGRRGEGQKKFICLTTKYNIISLSFDSSRLFLHHTYTVCIFI